MKINQIFYPNSKKMQIKTLIPHRLRRNKSTVLSKPLSINRWRYFSIRSQERVVLIKNGDLMQSIKKVQNWSPCPRGSRIGDLAHLVGLSLIIVAITAHHLYMSKAQSFQSTSKQYHIECKFLSPINLPYYSKVLNFIPYICEITMIHTCNRAHQMMTSSRCDVFKIAKN